MIAQQTARTHVSAYTEARDSLPQHRRRWLVTGAAGYIGSALVRAIGERDVLATDQAAAPFAGALTGNLAYPPFARSLVAREKRP